MKRATACLSSFALGISAALAQVAPPSAGSLMREIKPPEPFPKGEESIFLKKKEAKESRPSSAVRFKVKKITITGAQAISLDVLQSLVADAQNKALTLAELEACAQRITDYYRNAGYLLARAYLPAQQIKNGEVRIVVLEGRLGKLKIDNRSALPETHVQNRLRQLKEGDALDGNQIERELLLLSDMPGVKVQSTLKPGESVGTTDLDIRLEPDKAYSLTTFLDNHGNRFTGEWRGGAYLTLGNPFGQGDTLDVRAITSSDLHYGRLAWQVPTGSRSTQLGAAFSVMHYRLIEDYQSLDAHGVALISSVYAVHPFVRSRSKNLNGQLVFEHKTLKDDIDSTGTITRKQINLLTLGLSGDSVDGFGGGGMMRWSLSASKGELNMDSESLALDAAGYRTAGAFGKLNLSAARLQRLSGSWRVYVNLQAQLADKNLDSAEKMTLGGAQGVRAYPQGETSADDAWLGTVELRYAFAADWHASLFYDRARARINHDPLASDEDNTKTLAGYGLGLSYMLRDFSMHVMMAWRDGEPSASDKDRCPRVWGEASKRF